jgi:hypothetical protein
MSILATFTKQPAEVQDYDIDFGEYLSTVSDTALTHTVVADTGITVQSSSLTGGVVKVWLAGGTTGTKYKITARLTTTGGRVKEAEVVVKVKEV